LIDEHLKLHSVAGLVVVGPILRDLGDRSLPAIAVDREIRGFYEQLSAGHRPAAWLPPNSSLERQVLLDCGGYDEEFSKAREDTELGMRLADRGMRFQYAPKAVVHQRYTKSAADLVADGAWFGRNDVRLLRKRADYLPFSNLSQIHQGPAWKQFGRRLLSASPFSLELLFALAYRLFEQFKQIGTLREAGIRVLNLSRYSVWLRAAVKEAGDWNNLRSLIEAARRSVRGSTA
jgi:GT2 family glycosyltransferase